MVQSNVVRLRKNGKHTKDDSSLLLSSTLSLSSKVNDDETNTDNSVVLLDQDEQDTIIQQMINEVIAYQQSVYKYFRVVCYVTACICFCGTIILEYHHHNNNNNNSTINNVPTSSSSLLSVDEKDTDQCVLLRWLHTILSISLHYTTPSTLDISQSQTYLSLSPPTSGSSGSSIRQSSVRTVLIMFMFLILSNLCVGISILVLYKLQQQYQLMSMTLSSENNNNYNSNIIDEWYYCHMKLLASNVITVLVSFYLQREIFSSRNAIHNLQQSKYHYKSL
jgi:hypothetical protein